MIRSPQAAQFFPSNLIQPTSGASAPPVVATQAAN
jgi:hypothetical protein